MSLCTNAAMVLYYDIAGDTADHDDWHTYEHLHERLSIPGFVRATRWIATAGAPKYMVIYEVENTGVATSTAYLARLNNPTPWTTSMMSRFRGMVRGFCSVVGEAGFGLGNAAMSLRFQPADGEEANAKDWLVREVLPAMASRRGMGGLHLLLPAPPPPMTKEQSIRGADMPMTWLLLATAYDSEALSREVAEHLGPDAFKRLGISVERNTYALHYTVTAQEVARTTPHPPILAGDPRLTGASR